MMMSVGTSIHFGQHYQKLQKYAKSRKIASGNICAHEKRVLVKPTPCHTLSFADGTRTDITSSMMRFVKENTVKLIFRLIVHI